jgi:hypothetical protein
VIFFEKNEFIQSPMAASSSGTYAKKFGKENHPKNITLVNDELPPRVVAQNENSAHPTGGEKTLRANRDSSNNSYTAREEAHKNNRYSQVGEKTLRANCDSSNISYTAREEAHNKNSASQVGGKTLRADRDCSTSRGSMPAELKGNTKPSTEGKKKSVQFSGVNDTKDGGNNPMGEEHHIVVNKRNDKGSCGHTTTGGKQYQPKQQLTTTTSLAAAPNSHPTHIPPVSHKDTH